MKEHIYVHEERFATFFNHDGDVKEHVLQYLQEQLDPTKSPGSPLRYKYTTNAGISAITAEFQHVVNSRARKFIDLGEHLWGLRYSDEELFYSMLGYDEDVVLDDSICVWLLSNGYTDPVLLKVKPEPRVVGKVPRLVCMVSSVMNTNARLGLMNPVIQEQRSTDTNTAVALDLNTQAETMKLYDKFKSNAPLSSSDVQGWEYANDVVSFWSDFSRWLYSLGLVDLDFNIIADASYVYYLMGLFFCELHRVMQTECGNLFVTVLGLVTSGGYITFSGNSNKRSLLSYRVSKSLSLKLRFVFSAGDDNMDSNPYASEIYKAFGYVITDFVVQETSFNFCSTVFTENGSYQENISKSFVNMMYDQSSWEEKLVAFRLNFRFHPEYSHYKELLLLNAPVEEQC